MGEQYNAKKCFEIGGSYYNGRGVKQSDKKAMKWYAMASDNENMYARHTFELIRRW